MIEYLRIMKKFKVLDIVIIIMALVLVIFAVSFLRDNFGKGSYVKISTPNADYIYTLQENTQISVEGVLGKSVISINEGRAYFDSSACDNKLCVHSSPISDSTGFIACLPNKVFLTIEENEKKKTEEFDSIGY